MKKMLIITALVTSLLQAEVYYKNKSNQNDYKDDSISFSNATIFRANQYNDYIELTISTKEHGRIRTKVNNYIRLKEGATVSGSCSNYEYGEYKSCYIR
mgnify:CR=1 FL=1